MPDLNFETQLDREFGEFADEAAHYAPVIAEQVLTDILQTGPYWSGRSYASWVASLDAPIVQEAVDVPKKPGGIAAEDARQRALATLVNLEAFRLGQTIYLSQGTDYLKLIEDGTHGDNAGFIATVLSRYEGIINLGVTY